MILSQKLSKHVKPEGLTVGQFRVFGINSAESGWLTCDGAAVLRTAYPLLFALYSALGYPWGSGDGVTTFNIPDLRGRLMICSGTGPGLPGVALGEVAGAETVLLTIAQIPAHNHTFTIREYYSYMTHDGGTLDVARARGNIDTDFTGGTSAHQNMGPSAVFKMMVYTGNV